MFPLGHLEKSEVRAIAEKAGLATAKKKIQPASALLVRRTLKNFWEIIYQLNLVA